MVHNYDILNNTYEGNGVYTYSYIGNYFADVLNEGNATGVCNSISTVTAPGSSTTDYVGNSSLRNLRAGLWTDRLGPGHHGLRLLLLKITGS